MGIKQLSEQKRAHAQSCSTGNVAGGGAVATGSTWTKAGLGSISDTTCHISMPPTHRIHLNMSGAACGHFMYFAFGSNLLKERLQLANPSAAFCATGRLKVFKSVCEQLFVFSSSSS